MKIKKYSKTCRALIRDVLEEFEDDWGEMAEIRNQYMAKKYGNGLAVNPKTAQDMREDAEEILEAVCEEDNQFHSCGWFTATKNEGVDEGGPWIRLNLYFGLSSVSDGRNYKGEKPVAGEWEI